ncbi:MAG TPA: nucleotide-binding domain containing protein, partial [Bacillales bacterium]|nr:nucleotide-binding domain containing protein [Bacillales bacterium]
PQTAKQVDHMRENGTYVLELETLALFDDNTKERTIRSHVRGISERLRNREDTVVHTSNIREKVEQTRAEGEKRGLTKKDVSRLVSNALAEIVCGVIGEIGLNRMLVAGGDTSAAVCKRLGINGMQIWREIEPGLPSCLTFSQPPMLFVLKSGSFGKTDFFETAFDHLKTAKRGESNDCRPSPQ